MCHIFFIHSSVDGHLGCFQVLAIVNRAAMKYYSAIKRNKTELFVVRWINLQTVIQSEVRQKEKNKYHILAHIYGA